MYNGNIYYTSNVTDPIITSVVKAMINKDKPIDLSEVVETICKKYPGLYSWDQNHLREIHSRIRSVLPDMGLHIINYDVYIKHIVPLVPVKSLPKPLIDTKKRKIMTYDTYNPDEEEDEEEEDEEDDLEDEEEEEEGYPSTTPVKTKLDDKTVKKYINEYYTEYVTEGGDAYLTFSYIVDTIIGDETKYLDETYLKAQVERLVKDSGKYVSFTDLDADKGFVHKNDISKVKIHVSDSQYKKLLLPNNSKDKKVTKTMATKASAVSCGVADVGKKVLDLAKKANKEATKRNGVRAVSIATAQGAKALVKASGVKNQASKVFMESCDTKAGIAIGKGLLGFLAAFIPQLEDDELFQMLAEEARNQCVEDGQQVFGEHMAQYVLPLVSQSLDTLRKDPAIQQMLKDRKLVK